MVQSCERKGSLDKDIRNAIPNQIREFSESHPTLRRIVLANGGSSAKLFRKLFKSWLETGELVPGEDAESQKVFPSMTKKLRKSKSVASDKRRISLIAAVSVSPTAAKYSYKEKRDYWEKYVYQPGMNDFYHWKKPILDDDTSETSE